MRALTARDMRSRRMDIKKNDVFTVQIEDMSEDGVGIGKLDGYIWFIKDAVIGDVVEAKAMKMKKSYGFARMMKVVEPSPHRVEPKCPVARQCGGCQLQALSYEEQLKFKERKVYNNLVRIGKFDNVVENPSGFCRLWGWTSRGDTGTRPSSRLGRIRMVR